MVALRALRSRCSGSPWRRALLGPVNSFLCWAWTHDLFLLSGLWARGRRVLILIRSYYVVFDFRLFPCEVQGEVIGGRRPAFSRSRSWLCSLLTDQCYMRIQRTAFCSFWRRGCGCWLSFGLHVDLDGLNLLLLCLNDGVLLRLLRPGFLRRENFSIGAELRLHILFG